MHSSEILYKSFHLLDDEREISILIEQKIIMKQFAIFYRGNVCSLKQRGGYLRVHFISMRLL